MFFPMGSAPALTRPLAAPIRDRPKPPFSPSAIASATRPSLAATRPASAAHTTLAFFRTMEPGTCSRSRPPTDAGSSSATSLPLPVPASVVSHASRRLLTMRAAGSTTCMTTSTGLPKLIRSLTVRGRSPRPPTRMTAPRHASRRSAILAATTSARRRAVARHL